jgi:L-2-hydroxycarboxylate dehydrogenase (NAD+)
MPLPSTGPDTRPRYAAGDLRAFTQAVFEHYGVPRDDAEIGAEVLIDADLAGIESHGIAHLPWHPGYAPGLQRGIVNPRPTIAVLRESSVAATWDAGGGIGVITAQKAMIGVRNGRHFGAAGYYAHMAAKRDMIGMAMCNVPPIGLAAGGRERIYGTNPIAFGAPVEDDTPFLLDIATTAVAGGKLEIAMRQGLPIPAGWAVDAEGKDSDDPSILRKGGALLPLGSYLETSSHKGYGLGLMVDILSGVLNGTGPGVFVDRATLVQGHWFAAWRIDAFRDIGEFKAEMKRWVDRIRAIPPAESVESVMIPGDPEARARADREKNGVPLDSETIEQLTKLGEEVGRPFPGAIG